VKILICFYGTIRPYRSLIFKSTLSLGGLRVFLKILAGVVKEYEKLLYIRVI